MKNLIPLLLVLLSFCSCKSSAQQLDKSQVWVLTQMRTGRANIKTEGPKMNWQEQITLYTNGTFTKTRETKKGVTEAKGTYLFEEAYEAKTVKLIYSLKNELIASCAGNLTEVLNLISNTEIQGTWMACDGPRLTYKLSE